MKKNAVQTRWYILFSVGSIISLKLRQYQQKTSVSEAGKRMDICNFTFSGGVNKGPAYWRVKRLKFMRFDVQIQRDRKKCAIYELGNLGNCNSCAFEMVAELESQQRSFQAFCKDVTYLAKVHLLNIYTSSPLGYQMQPEEIVVFLIWYKRSSWRHRITVCAAFQSKFSCISDLTMATVRWVSLILALHCLMLAVFCMFQGLFVFLTLLWFFFGLVTIASLEMSSEIILQQTSIISLYLISLLIKNAVANSIVV